MRNFIFLMMLSAFMFAAETPSVIKPALDSFEGDAAKAYALYLQAVAKASDKATKEMEAKLKVATKGGNLELANAIKKEIEALAKGDTITALETKWKAEIGTDLLTPAGVTDTLVSKWGDGNTVMWDFKADGTGQHFWGGAIYILKWKKTETGYTVLLNGRAPRVLTFVDKNTINVEPGNSLRMK